MGWYGRVGALTCLYEQGQSNGQGGSPVSVRAGLRFGGRSVRAAARALARIGGADERADFCTGFFAALAGELAVWMGPARAANVLWGLVLALDIDAGDPAVELTADRSDTCH